jgi:MscS family membrane protein
MISLQNWLDTYLPGNTAESVLWFAGLLLIGLPAHRLLARLVSRGFHRFLTREMGGVSLADVTDLMRPPIDALIVLTVVFVALAQLTVPTTWHWQSVAEFGPVRLFFMTYKTVWMGAITWAVVRGVRVISLIFESRAKLTPDKFDDQLVPFLRDLAIVIVVFLVGLLTLGVVFEVNVLALVTSLGIGGLAVALAARETLENLFASFAILLDRPFLVGDAITSGGIAGDIERIGIRSTRLRTDDGSLLIVPNRLLVGQSVENLSQRQRRRAQFMLYFDLDTPPNILQDLLSELRNILITNDLTRAEPSLVRLDTLAERAIEVRVIFFIQTPKLAIFRAGKEQINLALMQCIHQHGVRFSATVPGLILTPDTGK